jgi:hypothetical protein
MLMLFISLVVADIVRVSLVVGFEACRLADLLLVAHHCILYSARMSFCACRSSLVFVLSSSRHHDVAPVVFHVFPLDSRFSMFYCAQLFCSRRFAIASFASRSSGLPAL